MTILPGTPVLPAGRDTRGTVIELKGEFAQVLTEGKTEWLEIGSLTDVSDELLDKLLQEDHDPVQDFILTVDAVRLLTEYQFNPYVLASCTKIEAFPHQIDEVIWGLENDHIMIADEVGLGKTIIAAMIASELKARGLAGKTLYVVPKSLVLKWQDELMDRFDIDARIIDGNSVKMDDDPFSHSTFDYLASMDFLKIEKRRQMLKKIDLAIVDEAHKLKPGTDRYNLGLLLSENSSSMIFLTATPHHGDDDDFLGLVKLLNPFISDPAASSYLWKRHIKEDVVSMDGRTVFPRRESETIDIRLTNSEREINSMINDYIRARYAEAHTPSETSAVMFLGNIFRKRAASSLHSLRVSLARRRDRLTYVDTNTFAKKRGMVVSMEDENDEEYEDGPGDIETLTVGRNLEAEKRNLSDIIVKIDDLGGRDTKFDMLRRSIESAKSKHGNAKILLFTEYKDTLNYLEGLLSDKYNVGKIHGMMSQVERKEALFEFREGVHEIMLCTDAAGEGIDMQFCNIEFNYDIPWNPNRLEQRMGRIHRIGQKNNVFYYNLVVDRDETIDGHVLGRLLDKIDSIKGAIGSKNVFDILGTMIPPGMIEKIYKELAESPDADWEAIVARTEKEVELERKDKEDKMKLLFGNQRLDRRTLDGMRKQHKEVVDSGEIERFLEFWAETRGGKFEMKDRKTETVKIIPPRNMSRLGILHGTLNKDTARSRGMEYLVLGNRKIREILSREAGKRVATILSHPTREGILCVYRMSVMYSNNRPIKSRIVALFANEDGEITEVEPESLWGYGVSEAVINPRLVEGTKNRLDEELDSILRRFHDGEKADISKKKDNVKNMLQTYAASEIDKMQSQISGWREKLDDAPHFGALIKGNETKCNTIQATMDAKMRDTDVLFNTHFSSEMIAIAMVKAETDTNERMRVDRAGMKAVMDYEVRRAKTDEERDMIEDVSQRDSGYDVKGPGRMIEVKSFSSTGQPMLTSHEWSSARKHGDVYWLYVVEDALDETKSPEEKITAVPDPYRNLADMVVCVPETTTKYRIVEWTSVKKRFKTTSP